MGFPDIPVRGPFNPVNEPFIMVVYSSTFTNVQGDSDWSSYERNSGWYLLSSMTYGIPSEDNPTFNTDLSNVFTEGILTPFFSGKWNEITPISNLADQVGSSTFAQINYYKNGNSNIAGKDNRIWMPLLQTAAATTSGRTNWIANVSPMVLKGQPTKGGGWQLFASSPAGDGSPLWTSMNTAENWDAAPTDQQQRVDGDVPFQAATFTGNGHDFVTDPGGCYYNFETLYATDQNALSSSGMLYAGYPYRLTFRSNQNKEDDSFFPFRDMIQRISVDNNKTNRTISGDEYLDGKYYPAFRGLHYNGGILYSKPPANSDGKRVFNMRNNKFSSTTTNLDDTVQVYLIPITLFQSANGNVCPALIEDQLTGRLVINQIYPTIYGGGYIDQCNVSTTRPAYCSFSIPEQCTRNKWYNYCTTVDTYCGACLGGCSDDKTPYCITSVTGPNLFVCDSVNPAEPQPPPPPPPTPEGFWEKYKTAIISTITGVTIILGITLILVIVLVIRRNRSQ